MSLRRAPVLELAGAALNPDALTISLTLTSIGLFVLLVIFVRRR